MSNNHQTVYTQDKAKQITVVREFDAPVDQVWKAWTDRNMLDQWWAPQPWKARTKSQDFKAGGSWQYAMVGPDGEEHWARFDYENITPQKSFSGRDSFTDDKGVKNEALPSLNWNTQFAPSGNGTKVTVLISADDQKHLDQIVEMGFKEGFAKGHENLDALLEKEAVH